MDDYFTVKGALQLTNAGDRPSMGKDEALNATLLPEPILAALCPRGESIRVLPSFSTMR